MGRHAVSDPTAHPTMGSFAAAVFGVKNNATQHQRGVSKAEAVPTCAYNAALRAVPAKGRAVSSHRTSQPNPGGIGGFWGGFLDLSRRNLANWECRAKPSCSFRRHHCSRCPPSRMRHLLRRASNSRRFRRRSPSGGRGRGGSMGSVGRGGRGGGRGGGAGGKWGYMGSVGGIWGEWGGYGDPHPTLATCHIGPAPLV